MEDPRASRKRRRVMDINIDLTDTKFGAVRRVLVDLRPFIIEVLGTPDYINSRAVPVIRQGTKRMRDFCKQLRAETVLLAKQKKANDNAFTSPFTIKDNAFTGPFTRPFITKEHGEDHAMKRQEEQTPIYLDEPGNPLVGGSPSGWNFILLRNQSRKDHTM